jgi:hypothetical protein
MSNLFHDDHYRRSELTKGEQINRCRAALNHGGILHGGKLSVALAEENTADFYDVGLVVFSDEAKARILGVRPETLSALYRRQRTDGDRDGRQYPRHCPGGYQHRHQRIRWPGRGRRRHGGGDGLFAWNIRGETKTRTVLFSGDCQDVVEKAVHFSLAELVTTLSDGNNG